MQVNPLYIKIMNIMKFKLLVDNSMTPQQTVDFINSHINTLKIIHDNKNIYLTLDFNSNNKMDLLPKVLIHYICNYLKIQDLNNLNLSSKKNK